MLHSIGVDGLLAGLEKLTHSCSSFGVWGSRTKDKDLWVGRNLDWASNTGLSKNKLLTVVHPPKSEGTKYAHVNVAYAGLWGALTGMSEAGIVGTEIGLDTRAETWLGLAWVMRLRYIFENAEDLPRAMTLWDYTNNTMGIMHGIGSSATGKYVIIETNSLRSAYYLDNDVRQVNAHMNGTHYGYPLKDAVWRTGHAFDPEIMRYAFHPYPVGDVEEGSMTRYMLTYNAFKEYEAQAPNYIDAL